MRKNNRPQSRPPATPGPEDLLKGVTVALGASAMVCQYTAAALIAAAAERGAIDPERVFQLLEVLASGFDSGAMSNKETGKMTALMLRAVEPTFRNLVKIPPGAGRA